MYIHVAIHVHTHTYMHTSVNVYIYIMSQIEDIHNTCIYIYICMYIYICICNILCIHTYICIYVYTHLPRARNVAYLNMVTWPSREALMAQDHRGTQSRCLDVEGDALFDSARAAGIIAWPTLRLKRAQNPYLIWFLGRKTLKFWSLEP